MTKHILTQDELKALLDYNPETGIFTWNISTGSVKAGNVADAEDKATGYYRFMLYGKAYLAHRLAWLYMHGYFPENEVDHINGVRHDNRIVNLRLATKSQNKRNTPKYANNKLGVKGVHFDSKRNKYKAQCWANGKQNNLGRFDTLAEAEAAYIAFAKENHQEFFHE